MSEHYFVDGYNVVHKSSILRSLVMKDFESAREAFIEKVANFCLVSRQQVTIIFDGRDEYSRVRDSRSSGGTPGLEIIYSPGGLSADAVIERMIYNAPRRLECVVVSNDRSLRDLCRGLGAMTMEADHFLKTVRSQQGVLREGIERQQRIAGKVTLLEDRLDGASMDRLRMLRDSLAPKRRK